MLTVTLPYPISANRYWNSFPLGKRIMTAPSSEAKAYKRDVAFLLKAAGVRDVIKGRVRVDIVLYAKRPQDWQKRQRQFGAHWDDTVQRIDLDNARKVLYDSLKNIAIEDDFWIWKDSGEVAEPDAHGPRVVVTITPIVVEQPQAAMFA
ncbi:TPA: RusA family crossover junction endodeoxyribonuclease [Burkholderia cenocepacia]|uniref:RusA family crossover junction endodeoxyribonuclease n=1 Tax=Burkholderia cenocepacia TaxID=95486 RepID=UPI001B8EE911|nr:RusA family crossover junction endodeoxyribonuclease [Burkholderia cenocepacia]MBR8435721.1 RusA family crossover junction endodeoxyribonuclease [Burkholderia cenocepacia]